MGQIIRQPNMGKKVPQVGGNTPVVPKPGLVGGNVSAGKPSPSVQISGNTYPGYQDGQRKVRSM